MTPDFYNSRLAALADELEKLTDSIYAAARSAAILTAEVGELAETRTDPGMEVHGRGAV